MELINKKNFQNFFSVPENQHKTGSSRLRLLETSQLGRSWNEFWPLAATGEGSSTANISSGLLRQKLNIFLFSILLLVSRVIERLLKATNSSSSG
ncbi:hypothetical protein T08_15971 [Trichinella sp. T8]|nr:hypothetical protein T08_15971 [Trichinella sp. T8]